MNCVLKCRKVIEAVAINGESKAVIVCAFVFVAEVVELFEDVADEDEGISCQSLLALVVDAFDDSEDHRDEYGDYGNHHDHFDEREAGF